MVTININKEFTSTPGARYRDDGPFSGEEFRETILEQYFQDIDDTSKITVVLDGTAGYATSFLEEAFGGLARNHGAEKVLSRLVFISKEDKLLVEEIKNYIRSSGES